jgi:DUF4097 and DUF4098 domain-containing protein YvlB
VARQVKESLKGLEGQHWEGKGDPFTEKFQKVLKAGGQVTVVLQNFSGDIAISGTGGSDVRIDATKRVRARDAAEGKAALEATQVEVTQRGDRIEVRVPVLQKGRHQRAGSVTFDLAVPAAANLEVKSVSGDITLAGVRGLVTAETVSGDVSASDIASESSLKSVSGDVQVAGGTVSGDVTANSVSGDVTTRSVKARGVTATTVSGDVVLQNTSCDRAVVKSLSGNLEVAGPLRSAARYELKSHSGDVRIAVDGKTGFELDASSWSGSLSSDLTLKGVTAPPADGSRQRSLQGVFGDGSAQIEATTFSGNVTVSRIK